DVSLVGFRANPYPFIARADLVALSSIREGLPTVLIEALALGTPVVSTDCPHGPREILAEGRYGPLVPVGDATSLAQAMYQTLSSPPQPEFLKEAARPYTLLEATRSYLEALF
ncbi:MAG TPA: glycosyltransferase, partial [Thermodesulfatator sp.]|nr:glycosyltransferase [Thermodesulfatator sp.]